MYTYLKYLQTDEQGCGDALLLHMAADQNLKITMCTYEERLEIVKTPMQGVEDEVAELSVSEDEVNDLHISDNPLEQYHAAAQDSLISQQQAEQTRIKLARAARTRRFVSEKIRRLFENDPRGQILHDCIDIE